jgi:hypothetical protein
MLPGNNGCNQQDKIKPETVICQIVPYQKNHQIKTYDIIGFPE